MSVGYSVNTGIPSIIGARSGNRNALAELTGEAFSEISVILRRNPDRVVGPDAAFVVKRSLPVRMLPEGYFETIPDLVVEIRNKNDSLADLFGE